jgi:hypothetical protein
MHPAQSYWDVSLEDGREVRPVRRRSGGSDQLCLAAAQRVDPRIGLPDMHS